MNIWEQLALVVFLLIAAWGWGWNVGQEHAQVRIDQQIELGQYVWPRGSARLQPLQPMPRGAGQ